MTKPIIGNYRPHPRIQLWCEEETLTKQAHRDECDVNMIMKKFERTGVLEHVRQYEGQYGDFIGAPDYHTAMNEVLKAQEMFMELPSKVRARYGNDPAAFLEACHDPDRVDELVELGLANPPSAGASPDGPAEPKKSAGKGGAELAQPESPEPAEPPSAAS